MSNSEDCGRPSTTRDEYFRTLADATRRDVVRIVRANSPTGIEKRDLAYRIAAVTNDVELAAVTDDQFQRALLDCHHRARAALGAAGLLEDDDGTIRTADHWAFDHGLIDALEARSDDEDDKLDSVFEALADSRRRTALTVLGEQYHPIATETLARDVAAREAGTTAREIPEDRLQAVHASLVHVHLPVLAEAGLVAYDADDRYVSYEGHPALRVAWLADDHAADDEPDRGDGGSGPDVRTLEGRETIVATGQSLCERAEDELFMMFTTTGLLEEGCFRRMEDALDRGVDVYLGTRDPQVREVVRERAPEVVLWEPQLDWLNLPPERDSVGRLVFADREAVLLGTLERSAAADREFDERAILGEGADNGLVVLMRQMLGSRLDHLDAQSADFQSEIPL